MSLADLSAWMNEISGSSYMWYLKRLSGNDTLANGSHQAGPYIPKNFLFEVFPSINKREIKNPDVHFKLGIDSHGLDYSIRAIWYNNKFHDNPENGRNETRLTNFGGIESPLLNPDSTGALTVFAFRRVPAGEIADCRVWICRNEFEEDMIEERTGPVEPGKFIIWSALPDYQPAITEQTTSRANCWLKNDEIPTSWLIKFPSGIDIVRKTIEMRSDRNLNADDRLIKRRDCEYEVFRSVEEAIEMPGITEGFANIDSFIAKAQTILQRRKARSGHSLEIHAREIFLEEGLKLNHEFSHQPESESGKSPDFLFPSEAAYKDKSFNADRLRMLAVKTTCKDRWRQILNEADRIPRKHLLTIQEGVSENQFREMTEAGVQLVVPSSLIKSFPDSVQPHLQSFSGFITEIKQ